MPNIETPEPNFAAQVRASFARQGLMTNIGACLTSILPGEVEIEVAWREDLTQQQGFVHGAIIAAIVDTACGYAAFTLMPPDVEVVTVEFKINFIAPAIGDKVMARGRVTKAGKTLTVCAGDAFAVQHGKEKLVATLQATMMTVTHKG
ncbi:MAG: PaaI family thioesterase [Acidobacteria bacterium]|nr:PaaI family thioesterase [Acidobacteriota bacterium]